MTEIGWIIVIIGCTFNVLSAIGVLRMPDFYTRLHASGVGESCGSIIALIGMIIINGFNFVSLKILLLIVFLLLLNPTSTHALINAGLRKSK
jgi:multicomponent Na+:H+ antiporter subunit G